MSYFQERSPDYGKVDGFPAATCTRIRKMQSLRIAADRQAIRCVDFVAGLIDGCASVVSLKFVE